MGKHLHKRFTEQEVMEIKVLEQQELADYILWI